MKKIICLMLSGILLTLAACGANIDYSDDVITGTGNATTYCGKDSVDELFSIIGESEYGGLWSGLEADKEHCFNVTPLSVAEETDIKIFKFSNSCLSLALIDSEVYEICNSFGGYGFVSAEPWDYDMDGCIDLLVTSSWGSGLHRSEISVFNAKTKESVIIHDTSATDNPRVDLFVTRTTSLSSDCDDKPAQFLIYSVDIETNNKNTYNLADLTCIPTGVYGTVDIRNGKPTFEPV